MQPAPQNPIHNIPETTDISINLPSITTMASQEENNNQLQVANDAILDFEAQLADLAIDLKRHLNGFRYRKGEMNAVEPKLTVLEHRQYFTPMMEWLGAGGFEGAEATVRDLLVDAEKALGIHQDTAVQQSTQGDDDRYKALLNRLENSERRYDGLQDLCKTLIHRVTNAEMQCAQLQVAMKEDETAIRTLMARVIGPETDLRIARQ